MAKVYEVYRAGKQGDLNEGESVLAVRSFHPRKGVAKRAARDLNGGKRLTPKCGIELKEHVIKGGRQGLCDFLNELINPGSAKKHKAPKTVKVKGKKTKKAKAKKK